jgi:hypothetical protein
MKATVHLPITQDCIVCVKTGDKIKPKTLLYQIPAKEESFDIPVARLLGIPAQTISKFLKKNIGQEIVKGDEVALKKSFFKKTVVRSPYDGKIQSIDLTVGYVSVSQFSDQKLTEVTSPVEGKVKEVGKSFIELEIEGEVMHGTKGAGNDSYGRTMYLEKDKITAMDIEGDIDEMVVVCRKLSEEAVVKLEVLGVRGIVACNIEKDPEVPWLTVSEEVFKKKTLKDAPNIWIRPKEKEFIVY